MVHARLRRAARAALAEPLAWFGLVAVLLLVFPGGPAEVPAPPLVSGADGDRLADAFAVRAGRPPTPEERRAMIRSAADEEAMVREARALGLGRDDPVIRARLVRKMQAALEAGPSPDEAALRAAFDADPDRYAPPPRVAFAQRLLPADTDPAAALIVLRAGGAPPPVPTSLPSQLALTPEPEVAALFGARFVAALADLAPGEWTGPVASPYGEHLVRVDAREAPPARFEDAREAVLADVAREQAAARRAAALAALRARHGEGGRE